MANFLGYECPKCTSMDEIEVAGTIWLRLTADGTDADLADNHHDHEYQSDSQAVCQACGFQGKFGEFEPPKPDPELLEALLQAVTALNTAPCFKVPALDSDSYRIAALCEGVLKAVRKG